MQSLSSACHYSRPDTILLVFPIVGLLMGAGQLASTIILVAGTSKDSGQSSKQDCNDTSTSNNASTGTTANGQTNGTTGTGNGTGTSGTVQRVGAYGVVGECTVNIGGLQSGLTLGLVAAGIAVAPLLAVWSVLQGALSAAGAIGGKIGGAVNSVQSRQKGKMSASLKENGEYRKNQMRRAAMTGGRWGTAVNIATGGTMRRSAQRRARHKTVEEDIGMAQEAYNRAARNGRRGTAEEAAEMLATRRRVSEQKMNAENIAAEHISVDALDTGNDHTGGTAGQEAMALIDGGNFDSPRLAALLEHLNQSNHTAFMAIASAASAANAARGGGSNLMTQTMSKSMGSSGIYSGSDISNMNAGNIVDLRQAAIANAASGGLSASSVAGASGNTLEALGHAIRGVYGRGSTNATAVRDANAAAVNAKAVLADMSAQQKDTMNQRKRNIVNGL